MRNVIAIIAIIGAVTHGVWAERERRHAKRWQGIATLEEAEMREEAVRLRLRNDTLERDLRLSYEKANKLGHALYLRRCALGEEITCCW
jgi:FtsZ-interacting cell division protein ZipA